MQWLWVRLGIRTNILYYVINSNIFITWVLYTCPIRSELFRIHHIDPRSAYPYYVHIHENKFAFAVHLFTFSTLAALMN